MSSEEWSQELTLAWWTDACLVRVALCLRGRHRWDIWRITSQKQQQHQILFFSAKKQLDLLFWGSHWVRGKMRHVGGKGASHGDTWRSRSADTHGGDAALTPTPQTAPETSPGCHKFKLGAVTWRKLMWAPLSLKQSQEIKDKARRCGEICVYPWERDKTESQWIQQNLTHLC